LQQTKLTDEKTEESSKFQGNDEASVLEQVIEKATAKHAIEQDIKGTSFTSSNATASKSHLQISQKA